MNAVLLVGRLGQLTTRETKGATPKRYITFSIATTEWTGRGEKTAWHQCTWFEPTDLGFQLETGQHLAVRGELAYRKDEQDRTWTYVRVRQIEPIGKRPSRRDAR